MNMTDFDDLIFHGNEGDTYTSRAYFSAEHVTLVAVLTHEDKSQTVTVARTAASHDGDPESPVVMGVYDFSIDSKDGDLSYEGHSKGFTTDMETKFSIPWNSNIRELEKKHEAFVTSLKPVA